jgi:hypothetical protein
MKAACEGLSTRLGLGQNRMAEGCSKPKLRPRPRKDGSAWYVEITWPDGRIVHIGDFGSGTTANDWIAWEFPAYFRSKLAH